jgi:hypothetical protein
VTGVPSGANVGVQVKTYGNISGKGSPLAIGLLYTPIGAGSQTNVAPVMRGAAKKLAIFAPDRAFTTGLWVNEPMIAAGVDVLGETIPSIAVVELSGVPLPTVSVRYAGFRSGRLSYENRYDDTNTTQFPCCGTLPASFVYNGKRKGSETFTLAATGFPEATLVMNTEPENQSLATLLVANGYADDEAPDQTLEMFSETASGDAPPARAFIPKTSASVYGEDAQGNFWSGGTHYSNLGHVLGTVEMEEGAQAEARDAAGNIYALGLDGCTAYEYQANRYGSQNPIREIDDACGTPPPAGEFNSRMTVDAAGDVFVAVKVEVVSDAPTVREFATGSASGAVAPTRTVTLPPGTSGDYPYVLPSIDADAAGNVYVLGWMAFDEGNVYEISPGQTNATLALTAIDASQIAVDDAGDIFAWNSSVETVPSQINFYQAGSTTPSRTLTGSKTGLTDSGELTVAHAWSTSARRLAKLTK